MMALLKKPLPRKALPLNVFRTRRVASWAPLAPGTLLSRAASHQCWQAQPGRKPEPLLISPQPVRASPPQGSWAPQRMQVRYGDHVIADSRAALTLQESTYPAVIYFPREDV